MCCDQIVQIDIGRHNQGCLWIFGGQKELLRKKYLYGENELAANFHVMWFISLLLFSLLRYPWIYTSSLVVTFLRHVLSLTTERYTSKDISIITRTIKKWTTSHKSSWRARFCHINIFFLEVIFGLKKSKGALDSVYHCE